MSYWSDPVLWISDYIEAAWASVEWFS